MIKINSAKFNHGIGTNSIIEVNRNIVSPQLEYLTWLRSTVLSLIMESEQIVL